MVPCSRFVFVQHPTAHTQFTSIPTVLLLVLLCSTSISGHAKYATNDLVIFTFVEAADKGPPASPELLVLRYGFRQSAFAYDSERAAGP